MVGGWTWLAPVAGVLLVLPILVGAGAAADAAEPVQLSGFQPCGTHGVLSGTTDTCTYTTAGQDSFTMPAGVSSLQVIAVGGAGGRGGNATGFANAGAGGQGARVSAGLSSMPGTLVVDVGANGVAASDCALNQVSTGGSGGTNGGGAGGGGRCGSAGGGGGGGASDVRSTSSLSDSLVVAGGRGWFRRKRQER